MEDAAERKILKYSNLLRSVTSAGHRAYPADDITTFKQDTDLWQPNPISCAMSLQVLHTPKLAVSADKS